MLAVNVEENIGRWHRLCRHLNVNAYDPCLLFVNASLCSEADACPVQVDVGRSAEKTVSVHAMALGCVDVADVVVSPTLVYNRVSRHSPTLAEVFVCWRRLHDVSLSPLPQLAFRLLRSVDYHVELDVSASLRAYFSDHRIHVDVSHTSDDLLLVPLSELDRRRHMSEFGTDPGHVCLKVEAVKTCQSALCLIDPHETRLELVGVERDFVPRLAFSSALDEAVVDADDEERFSRASRAVEFVVGQWEEVEKTAYGLLLCGHAGFGQAELVQRLARRFSLNLVTVGVHEMASVTFATSATMLRSVLTGVASSGPCIVLLHDLDRMLRSREAGKSDPELCEVVVDVWSSLKSQSPKFPLILAAMVEEEEELPARLRRLFIETLAFPAPDRHRRLRFLRRLVDQHFLSVPPRLLHYLAQRSAGFPAAHLRLLVDALAAQPLGDAAHPISDAAADAALQQAFKLTGRRFRPQDIPDVAWRDVGGLQAVIDEIVSAVQMTGAGTGAGGILLYGPPGTGKTLLAKAVARECSLNFLSVKGPELLNQYVGQSEANVRQLFARAREAAPCVVFCDELDSLAPRRGRAGDSGGVMDRVVAQLMSEMEASTEVAPVQVIAATNRPDLLDEALLRPGRFDRLVYVGVSDCPHKHIAILKAQTRKLPLDSVELEAIVALLPDRVTGADLYGVCADAWRSAVGRHVEEGGEGRFAVTMEDFEAAARAMVPSVKEEELRRYEELRTGMGK